jgi:hypothetical protein
MVSHCIDGAKAMDADGALQIRSLVLVRSVDIPPRGNDGRVDLGTPSLLREVVFFRPAQNGGKWTSSRFHPLWATSCLRIAANTPLDSLRFHKHIALSTRQAGDTKKGTTTSSHREPLACIVEEATTLASSRACRHVIHFAFVMFASDGGQIDKLIIQFAHIGLHRRIYRSQFAPTLAMRSAALSSPFDSAILSAIS